jgi:hypothetical protein
MFREGREKAWSFVILILTISCLCLHNSINNPHGKVQRASKNLLTSLNPFMISEVKKFDDTAAAFIQVITVARYAIA